MVPRNRVPLELPPGFLGPQRQWLALVFGALVATVALAWPFTREIVQDVYGGLLTPTSLARFERRPTPAERARGLLWFTGRIEAFERRPETPEVTGDYWGSCMLRAEHYSCGGSSRGGSSCGWAAAGSWSYFTVTATGQSERAVMSPRHIARGRREDIAANDDYLGRLTTAWKLRPAGDGVRYYWSCFEVGMPVTVDGVAAPDGRVHPPPFRDFAAVVEDDDARDARLWDMSIWNAIAPLTLSAAIYWLFGTLVAYLEGSVLNVFGKLMGSRPPTGREAIAGALFGAVVGGYFWHRLGHHWAPVVLYPAYLLWCGVVAGRLRRRASTLAVAAELVTSGAADDLLLRDTGETARVLALYRDGALVAFFGDDRSVLMRAVERDRRMLVIPWLGLALAFGAFVWSAVRLFHP